MYQIQKIMYHKKLEQINNILGFKLLINNSKIINEYATNNEYAIITKHKYYITPQKSNVLRPKIYEQKKKIFNMFINKKQRIETPYNSTKNTYTITINL